MVSWLGTTTLAILLAILAAVATFVITVVIKVRVITGHWFQVAVFRNQARDLAKGFVIGEVVLLATTLTVFLVAVPVTVLRDHNDLVAANARLISETHKRPEKEHAPQQSVNPDESNRARALRDQHYELLRPVLKSELSHLKGIAEQIRTQGHFAPMREGGAKNNASAELWPEVMSRDLANHFGEYDKAKQHLQSEIDALDSEFRQTLSSVESQIKPAEDLTPYWTRTAALNFVEKCLGHWDGIKFIIQGNGYNFESLGGIGGGSSIPPPPDQVAAAQAYQSIEPTAMGEHCESLKRRVEKIRSTTEDLSKQAILLSEKVVLNGTCQFLKKPSRQLLSICSACSCLVSES
jgi:hypothetical protein